MPDYKIEVPIKLKGTGGKGIGKEMADAFSKQVKALTKGIGVGEAGAGGIGAIGKKAVGWLAIIALAIEGLSFMLKPVMSLFKMILMLLFLPLIPILKPVLTALKSFIDSIKKAETEAPQISTTGEPILDIPIVIANWALKIGYAIGDFLFQLGKGAFELGVRIGNWLYEKVITPAADFITGVILSVADWIADKIRIAWEFLSNVGEWLWDKIIFPAWNFLKDVGMWIWDQILFPAWNFLKDVGKWVWDLIKSPWEWLAGKIRNIWDWIKDAMSSMIPKFLRGDQKDDFISRPGQAPVSFNPADTIIGVKDISKLGGGSITININNPSVRQTSDIKNLANEVSRVLQRKMTGRISSG